MKKRIVALLLAAVLLAVSVPRVWASGSVWFVAVNDRIPQTMSSATEPFYVNGRLYIPQSAFGVYPFNVVPSYSESKKQLVLFDKNRRLVYDLEAKTRTDKDGNSSKVEVVYRGGEVFIPAKDVEHFGIQVKLLENDDGYLILRFYDGSQVYDDDKFLEQAQPLIDHQVELSAQGQLSPNGEGTDPEADSGEEEEPEVSMTYAVFSGAAVSRETLLALENQGAHGAFFLTEQQITADPDLVRDLHRGGHTVGITVADGSADVQTALDLANEALDDVLVRKTLFALLPKGTTKQPVGYRILSVPGIPEEGTVPLITHLSGQDAPNLVAQMPAQNIQILLLRISTPVF